MRMRQVLSLLVAGALCRPGTTSAQASGTMAGHSHMPMQPGGPVSGLLTSPSGSRGPSGTVTVTGTTVHVVWAGDQPGTTRAWSLRRGSCARVEGIVGAATSYNALVVDAAGTAQGTATLSAPLATDSAVVVVVQPLPNEANSPVLACGSISNGVRLARGAPSVDRATMDRATMDHSTMDHSTMKAPAMNRSGMNMSGAADSGAAGLRAIHLRMMADPVIRERVRTDPVLQRMLADLPAGEASITSMDMPGMTGAAATQSDTKPAAKRAPAPSKPTAKPKAKPAPDPMAGMDHSKMPGMRKPPA